MVLLKISFKLDPAMYGDGKTIDPALFSVIFPEEQAREMDKLPGLIWKLWCSRTEECEGDGFYLFATRSDAEYRAHVAHKYFPQMPGLTDVQTCIFDVDEDLSRFTRGPVDLPANPSKEPKK